MLMISITYGIIFAIYGYNVGDILATIIGIILIVISLPLTILMVFYLSHIKPDKKD
jgi:hypothetical protein